MRKTLLSAVIVVMFIFSALPLGVFAADFPDVEITHSNYDAIMHLTELGVIAGYDDGTFKPDREITRTEFCALMARTLGYNKETYVMTGVPFDDVSEGYWGMAYISFCYEKGLINGMGDGTFAPANKVTMGQAVKMAVCAVGKEPEALKNQGEKWYSGYMRVAEKYDLLDNTNQTAEENAVRQNVAQIVYNMVMTGLIEEEEELPEDSETDSGQADEDEQSEEKVLTELEKTYLKKDFSDVKVILIDPGHNYEGKDTGAENIELDVREEEITWLIADKLREELEELGYVVVMTREEMTDSIVNTSALESLQARVNMAHDVLADLYISIHCNTGGGSGIETYCFSLGGYAARLAGLVQDKVSDATGLYDRGVKTANFFVNKNTLMPSILVETGFMDNEKDMEVLTSGDGQRQIAVAIAEAVREYDMMEPIKRIVQEEEQNDEEA